MLVIATGSKGAHSGSGICGVAVDGASSASQFLGAGQAHDGFAITKTTSRLPAGPHTVALQCTESKPDLTIDNPTIAAVAVTTDNHWAGSRFTSAREASVGWLSVFGSQTTFGAEPLAETLARRRRAKTPRPWTTPFGA